MSRKQIDPLRPLDEHEREQLQHRCRSRRAPAAQAARARALLAVAAGQSYTEAAALVGLRVGDTVRGWVARFNHEGLAALTPRHGGGPRPRYGLEQQRRILAEWQRTPDREQDGTATWSLTTLQKALRRAPDGLPQVSTHTIWTTLQQAGLSWQKSRTWCETGVVVRQRKHGVATMRDVDAEGKKA
jgi:transposase